MYFIKYAILIVLSQLLLLILTVAGSTKPLPVAVFVPYALFRDDVFEKVVRVIERNSLLVVVVSTDTVSTQGIDGLMVKPQRLIGEITPEEFSALVLLDGAACAPLWNDTLLHNRCRAFATAGRVVAAIELAPLILAHAGILANRKATVFPDHYAIGVLKNSGARHRFNPVVKDGNIITAARADNAVNFARLLVKTLKPK